MWSIIVHGGRPGLWPFLISRAHHDYLLTRIEPVSTRLGGGPQIIGALNITHQLNSALPAQASIVREARVGDTAPLERGNLSEGRPKPPCPLFPVGGFFHHDLFCASSADCL